MQGLVLKLDVNQGGGPCEAKAFTCPLLSQAKTAGKAYRMGLPGRYMPPPPTLHTIHNHPPLHPFLSPHLASCRPHDHHVHYHRPMQ